MQHAVPVYRKRFKALFIPLVTQRRASKSGKENRRQHETVHSDHVHPACALRNPLPWLRCFYLVARFKKVSPLLLFFPAVLAETNTVLMLCCVEQVPQDKSKILLEQCCSVAPSESQTMRH